MLHSTAGVAISADSEDKVDPQHGNLLFAVPMCLSDYLFQDGVCEACGSVGEVGVQKEKTGCYLVAVVVVGFEFENPTVNRTGVMSTRFVAP